MAIEGLRDVGLSESSVRERICWVAFNRLAKVLHASGETVLRSLRPVEAALEVQVIRLDVAGMTTNERLRVLARQREPQVLGDLSCDLFFGGEDVIGPPAILRAPDAPAFDVGQLHRDLQCVATLQHASREHGFDAQRASNVQCPIGLTLVAEHRALCRHFEQRQSRQAKDETLGHAVAEIVHLRVAAGVDERQHGE